MRVQYLGPAVLLVTAAVLIVTSISDTSETSAFDPYLASFNAKYGTSGTALDSCLTCHNADFTWNPYGLAVMAQAGTIDARLTAVESADSDGDGYSNIAEITARTLPGDATSFPGGGPTPTPVPPLVLTSQRVLTAPVIDGNAGDAVWSGATAVDIAVAGGANMGSTTVSVKSVYTNDHVYFLLDYADPTLSNQRMPWKKQADGSWLKLSTSTTHQENSYYEDKLAMAWDINVTGFAQSGCAVLCHAGEQPANSGYGNKYTPNIGEEADLWHWKYVRTDPVGQVDDQYVNGDHYDATTAPEAGRHSDPKTGGGYSDNITANAQGDVDCSGGATPVSAVDALKILRKVAGLTVVQNEPCTDIGTMGPPLQGDVDCSGSVTAVDALKILRKVAGLSVVQQEPCFDIGIKGPRFTSPDQPTPPYWILDADKQPFLDNFSTNDEIAGIIAQAFTGDRGDIQGKGAYSGGHWTLEIGRLLTTAGGHDIQFSNLSATYPFAVAVFDNAQVNHAYQNGVSKLQFAP